MVFLCVDKVIQNAVKRLPTFKSLTVLPQVVSQVMHKSTHVQAIVHKILTQVLRSYPNQSLWATVLGVESSSSARSSRVLQDAMVQSYDVSTQAGQTSIDCTLTMESEVYMCAWEQVNGAKQVIIIDLANSNTVMQRPISAKSAIMHPCPKVIALWITAQSLSRLPLQPRFEHSDNKSNSDEEDEDHKSPPDSCQSSCHRLSPSSAPPPHQFKGRTPGIFGLCHLLRLGLFHLFHSGHINPFIILNAVIPTCERNGSRRQEPAN
ncbi:hypothetical protein PCASD_22319 [Puccinia coronata f. sp. avenae]|uniref:FAT domain-containing protein n=1 Tax=Puccinia coronata f. sp. avenae TaxID=200324 RepID=A0A2N5TW25_9BASI|nr:hypothetical protein PCASD_22319 [Puccinia coronata f. sp. avenae]